MDKMKTLKGMAVALAIGIAIGELGPAMARDTNHHHDSSNRMSKFSPEERAFLAENDKAMTRMMAAMDVAPTGDVDRDFVAMMIPHHQGAIDMARAVLGSSRNEVVRRLAQEIIVTQQDEIRAMRLAVGDPPIPASSRSNGITGQEH